MSGSCGCIRARSNTGSSFAPLHARCTIVGRYLWPSSGALPPTTVPVHRHFCRLGLYRDCHGGGGGGHLLLCHLFAIQVCRAAGPQHLPGPPAVCLRPGDGAVQRHCVCRCGRFVNCGCGDDAATSVTDVRPAVCPRRPSAGVARVWPPSEGYEVLLYCVKKLSHASSCHPSPPPSFLPPPPLPRRSFAPSSSTVVGHQHGQACLRRVCGMKVSRRSQAALTTAWPSSRTLPGWPSAPGTCPHIPPSRRPAARRASLPRLREARRTTWCRPAPHPGLRA